MEEVDGKMEKKKERKEKKRKEKPTGTHQKAL